MLYFTLYLVCSIVQHKTKKCDDHHISKENLNNWLPHKNWAQQSSHDLKRAVFTYMAVNFWLVLTAGVVFQLGGKVVVCSENRDQLCVKQLRQSDLKADQLPQVSPLFSSSSSCSSSTVTECHNTNVHLCIINSSGRVFTPSPLLGMWICSSFFLLSCLF